VNLFRILFVFFSVFFFSQVYAQSFNAVGNNINGTVTFTWSNPNPYGIIYERVGSLTAASREIDGAAQGNGTRTLNRAVGTYYYNMTSCSVGGRGLNCVWSSSVIQITIAPPPSSSAQSSSVVVV
jgi:hypothetical protein